MICDTCVDKDNCPGYSSCYELGAIINVCSSYQQEPKPKYTLYVEYRNGGVRRIETSDLVVVTNYLTNSTVSQVTVTRNS